MNKEMVISVGADGSVSGMHFDAFNLAFLGERDVRRASELKFNEATQLWDIHLVSPHTGCVFAAIEGAKGFSSYEECREIEVRWLQGCRLAGVEPMSARGVRILAMARREPELYAGEIAEISRALR